MKFRASKAERNLQIPANEEILSNMCVKQLNVLCHFLGCQCVH